MLKGIDEDGELVNLRTTKNGELLVKMSGGTDTSDATAIAEDILQGKTAYAKNEKVEGTMKNNGQLNYTPSTSQQTIPAGYSTGGTINAVDSSIDSNIQPSNIKKDISILGVTGTLEEGIDTSDANATPTDLASGKTAYVNGNKITGSLSVVSAGNNSPVNFANSGYEMLGVKYTRFTVPSKKILSQGTFVTIPDSDLANGIRLTASKLMKGNTILGIQGTATSDADAQVTDISNGKTAYVNGQKITGTATILNAQAKTVTPTTAQQNIVPDSEYNALSQVAIEAVTSSIDSNILAENIKNGVSILGVEGTLESGIDTTDATADAGDIRYGRTAYVDGQKLTGTLTDIKELTYLIASMQWTDESHLSQWRLDIPVANDGIVENGITKIAVILHYDDLAEHIGLTADKIKSGETILGITGTYTGETEG